MVRTYITKPKLLSSTCVPFQLLMTIPLFRKVRATTFGPSKTKQSFASFYVFVKYNCETD